MNSTILMKTAIAFLLTLLVVIVPGYAQSQYLSADDSDREAVDLLTAAARKFTEKPSQVRFVLKISYPGQEKMVSDGTLYQSGKAYHLDLKEYAIFSDGTTRWVYLKGPNEINIYNESNGQDWISPQDFLLLHTSDELVLTLIGERPDGITIIEAKPLEGRFDYYSKFTIGVEQGQLKFIHALSSDGSRQEMSISRVIFPEQLDTQKLFSFQKENYPGVYVEDLRLD